MSGVGRRVKPAVGGVGGAADGGATQQNQTGSERAAKSAAGVLQEVPGETAEGKNYTVPESRKKKSLICSV